MVENHPGTAKTYLFLDTETSGIIKVGQPPPRLVEIAWLISDADGMITERDEFVIRLDGFMIPATVLSVHGITTEYARRVGVPLQDALTSLSLCLKKISLVIAHNFRFDNAVIEGECKRIGISNPLATLPSICTMEATTAFCGIRRGNGYKWPTLSELHETLFGVPFEDTHRAGSDVEACARCFFALRKKGFWDKV